MCDDEELRESPEDTSSNKRPRSAPPSPDKSPSISENLHAIKSALGSWKDDVGLKDMGTEFFATVSTFFTETNRAVDPLHEDDLVVVSSLDKLTPEARLKEIKRLMVAPIPPRQARAANAPPTKTAKTAKSTPPPPDRASAESLDANDPSDSPLSPAVLPAQKGKDLHDFFPRAQDPVAATDRPPPGVDCPPPTAPR